MECNGELVLSQQDAFAYPKFNTKIKFTPVMEEVLLTLEVLFVLKLTPRLTNCVNLLCEILSRSHRAVGTALQALADLELIKYYRQGSGRVIDLQLDNPFLVSSLYRFFGFDDRILKEKRKAKKQSPNRTIGFLPSAEKCSEYLSFLQSEKLQIQQDITKYQEWIDWIDEMEEINEQAKNILKGKIEPAEDDPHRIFVENILSTIKQKEEARSNRLYYQELLDIVREELQDNCEFPPWIDESTLQPQSTMLDDFLREKFYESKK